MKRKKIIEIFFFLRFLEAAPSCLLRLYWFVSCLLFAVCPELFAFRRMLFCLSVVNIELWRLRDVGEGGAMLDKRCFWCSDKKSSQIFGPGLKNVPQAGDFALGL
jgi:hypothetical protein